MLKKLKRLFKTEYFKTTDVGKRELQHDNRGSALVLVIVAVGFVTILASIVTSSAIVNHKIRSIDRRTKTDFYYAEKALDDIYTGIGEYCSIAMGEAYSEVAAGNGNSYTFTNQEDAYNAYKRRFIEKVWKSSLYEKAALEKYVTVVPGSGHKIDVDINTANIQYLKKDGVTAAAGTTDKDAKILKIKSLKVTCTEEATGYISSISTDIVIDVPDAHFFTVQESPLDYAIIANKGIVFNGGVTRINGRVYAGSDSTSSVAYNVENGADVTLIGDYLAARGDIDIKSGSKLTVGIDSVGSRIWFENLKLSGDNAELDAKNRTSLFALGDLEINGKSCKANLGGAYYGYNNEALSATGEPEYKTKEYEMTGRSASESANTFSSSIIVNGNESTVDVNNLQTLLLMGRAYVDFTSKPGSGTSVYEYPTGEGFALKTNQEIYLVPQEFITDGYTNPIAETESGVGSSFSFSSHVSFESGWFGESYLSSEKVKTVKVNGLYYAYLGLDKPGEYFERIAGATYDPSDTVSPTAYELKKKMEGSTANSVFAFNGLDFNDGANIYIHNGQASPDDRRNGSVEYNSGYISKANNIGLGAFGSYPNALYAKYRDLCTNLNANENIALGSADGVASVNDTDWANTNDFPAKKFISYSDPGTSSSTTPDSNYNGDSAQYEEDFKMDNSVYGTVIMKDSSINVADISSSMDGIFLFVDGNVTIPAGYKISGMIVATGTVTINGGGAASETVITSDNSLLQKRIDKELSNARHALANGRYDSTNKGKVYKSDYVISYLLDPNSASSERLYKYIAEDTYTDVVKEVTQTVSTDYKQYVTFDNWKKGE